MTLEEVIVNLKESAEAGCTLEGALENVLTAVLNNCEDGGDISVHIEGEYNKIFIATNHSDEVYEIFTFGN